MGKYDSSATGSLLEESLAVFCLLMWYSIGSSENRDLEKVSGELTAIQLTNGPVAS